MSKKFYVTTPIYYVNDIPHIGHAYTTIAADILARFHRLKGHDVFFLTGTDEHGQKVEKAASLKGRLPKEHSDLMVDNFKNLWGRLNISNDGFIRTTDKEHVRTVQELMQSLWNKGEIEKRQYSGWYCTPDERFWTEKEIVSGNCPDCGRPVEHIHEENYFFLMSKYQERITQHIKDNPSYILPETRRNEVLGFLNNNSLGDLCISRPKQRLSWGIPLPFDENFVTYVWFDALVNYYSATRYLVPENLKSQISNLKSEEWWPASHHIVGKDILTTHAVYWSAMLMALNLSLPENIFAHGWWTVEGKKMSKSIDNVVDPNAVIDKYGADAFRYFLFREVPFGLDGNFSEDALIKRINTELANDLGNLLSRFLTMAEKYFDGVIEYHIADDSISGDFKKECLSLYADITGNQYWSNLRFNIILEHIWSLINSANNHIAKTEPWKLFNSNQEILKGVLFNIWNVLRLVALSVYPFMPETSEKMWRQLGLKLLTDETRGSLTETESAKQGIFQWDWKPPYEIKVSKGEQLFPRIEKTQEKTQKTVQKEEKAKMELLSNKELIAIEDFAKIELKVGRVISAERVEKSNKLIRLRVDTGEERQVIAGIGKAYSPEELVGRKIVVVTNLKPVNLMGNESNGMLLAATGSDGVPVILIPEKDVEVGSKIK